MLGESSLTWTTGALAQHACVAAAGEPPLQAPNSNLDCGYNQAHFARQTGHLSAGGAKSTGTNWAVLGDPSADVSMEAIIGHPGRGEVGVQLGAASAVESAGVSPGVFVQQPQGPSVALGGNPGYTPGEGWQEEGKVGAPRWVPKTGPGSLPKPEEKTDEDRKAQVVRDKAKKGPSRSGKERSGHCRNPAYERAWLGYGWA